jgi:hypothetical protein
MPVPIVILRSDSPEFVQFFKELRESQKISETSYFVTHTMRWAGENIKPNASQMLIVGNSLPEFQFAREMKLIQPTLKVVRFGKFCMEGPPRPPYDVFVTCAHPVHTYKEFLEDVIYQFLVKQKL